MDGTQGVAGRYGGAASAVDHGRLRVLLHVICGVVVCQESQQARIGTRKAGEGRFEEWRNLLELWAWVRGRWWW
jgi:hypothetical protein